MDLESAIHKVGEGQLARIVTPVMYKLIAPRIAVPATTQPATLPALATEPA